MEMEPLRAYSHMSCDTCPDIQVPRWPAQSLERTVISANFQALSTPAAKKQAPGGMGSVCFTWCD